MAPLEVDKPKKKKLTKFDILMLNPKSLPRRTFHKEREIKTITPAEIVDERHEEDGEPEHGYEGRIGFTIS